MVVSIVDFIYTWSIEGVPDKNKHIGIVETKGDIILSDTISNLKVPTEGFKILRQN